MPADDEKAPSWRRRRWTGIESAAWIVFRQSKWVEIASSVKSLKGLAGVAAIPRKENIVVLREPAAAFLDADARLSALEKEGALVTDARGLFRREDVQRLFPSEEGRDGRRQKRPSANYERQGQLAGYMRANPPEYPTAPKSRRDRVDNQTPLQKFYDDCLEKGFVSKYDQFGPLWPEALERARGDIEAEARCVGAEPGALCLELDSVALADWWGRIERERANLDAWEQVKRAAQKRSPRARSAKRLHTKS
jgi:hypothetical protein